MNTGCAQVKSAINECRAVPECKTVHWGISDLHLRRCVWHRKECSKGLFNSSTRVQEPIREERAGARVFSETVTPRWAIFPALTDFAKFKEQLLAEIRLASLAGTCLSSSEGKKELQGESWSCSKARRDHWASSRCNRLQGRGHARGKAQVRNKNVEKLSREQWSREGKQQQQHRHCYFHGFLVFILNQKFHHWSGSLSVQGSPQFIHTLNQGSWKKRTWLVQGHKLVLQLS